jgi:hypothetical protein
LGNLRGFIRRFGPQAMVYGQRNSPPPALFGPTMGQPSQSKAIPPAGNTNRNKRAIFKWPNGIHQARESGLGKSLVLDR